MKRRGAEGQCLLDRELRASESLPDRTLLFEC
jgi:hypothetical protein